MLREVEWSEDRAYRTETDTEPIQFYFDGLCNSTKFDLLLGYFSSAAINVLSLGFATFLYSGGRMRVIVNNVMSKEDKEAIKKGSEGDVNDSAFDLMDIKELRRTLDDYGQHFFECLAWLIANDRIQIKIIKPKAGRGIAHYKSGIFSDGKDVVGFKASCNFTAYGLLENLEELDAFLSWENSRSSKMINRQNRDFEKIFSGNADYIDYLDIDEVAIAIKKEFNSKSLDELIIQEKELTEKKSKALANRNIRKRFEKAITRIEEIVREPKFPYPEGPRPYQSNAYESWQRNNFQGIFAMATGTGKTITSLNCILEEYKKEKAYKAVILVPTIGLANQWEEECSKFNFRNVIKINSSTNWQADLALISTVDKLTSTSYIVICTYASFYRPRFQEFFRALPKTTILIGDEVHNMGATTISRLFSQIHLNKRIGLSATPKRIYDEEGGSALEHFFNDKEPYVFSYSMKEAIDNGILCPYLYYPHVIRLTEIEFNEYINISKQLVKYFDSSNGTYLKDSMAEILLQKRKRIIHKAENKKVEFQRIVSEEYQRRGSLKYTLVYVPEGLEPDYSLNDVIYEDEEDLSIIDNYTKLISGIDRSVMVKQFTSSSQERERIIADYSQGKIHVLTSMKCLDEGIDVPRSEVAIFCASTGNPRQFIQRRGRILRRHKDKTYAVIHDLVVIPENTGDETTFQMERSLIQKELERVVNFSSLADNKTHTYQVFREILDQYNLNLNDFEY